MNSSEQRKLAPSTAFFGLIVFCIAGILFVYTYLNERDAAREYQEERYSVFEIRAHKKNRPSIDQYIPPNNVLRFRDLRINRSSDARELSNLINDPPVTSQDVRWLINELGVEKITSYLELLNLDSFERYETGTQVLYDYVFGILIEKSADDCIVFVRRLNPERLTAWHFSQLLKVALHDSSGRILMKIEESLVPLENWPGLASGDLLKKLVQSGDSLTSSIKMLESLSDDGFFASRVVLDYLRHDWSETVDLDSPDGKFLFNYIINSDNLYLEKDFLLGKLKAESLKENPPAMQDIGARDHD